VDLYDAALGFAGPEVPLLTLLADVFHCQDLRSPGCFSWSYQCTAARSSLPNS